MSKKSKNKIPVVVFSLLAILLLLTSSFMVSSVNAINLAMQYGHLNPSDYSEGEKTSEENVCDFIYDLFDADLWDGCEPVNAYWAPTTDTNVGNCLDWQFENASYVTNWWVGDFRPDASQTPGPYGHLWFYGHAGNDIEDAFVYDHATDSGEDSKNYFSFIWTCTNGGRYWNDPSGSYDIITGITYPTESPFSPPPTNTNDEYGFLDSGDAVGMPLAWTGDPDMALDGYNSGSGSYCYIGFEGPSPSMLDELEDSSDRAYVFPMTFYWKALGWDDPPYYIHQPIYASLDFTSDYIYDCYFDETPLYEGYWQYTIFGYCFVHMRVYGNACMDLPS